jgi:hypothetical protein
MPPDLLRAYLLGKGAEEERAQIEERLFEDDSFESLLAEAEADLLDDWAHGRLSAADTARVLQRFVKSKRDLALALAKKTRKPPRRWWWWAAIAAAAVIILAIALSSSRPLTQPEQIAELRLQQQATRGTNAPVYRPRTGRRIRLSVPLIEGYSDWKLRIEPAAAVAGEVSKTQISAVFELPDGRHELLLYGRGTKANVPELVAVYPFELQRDVSPNPPLEK